MGHLSTLRGEEETQGNLIMPGKITGSNASHPILRGGNLGPGEVTGFGKTLLPFS